MAECGGCGRANISSVRASCVCARIEQHLKFLPRPGAPTLQFRSGGGTARTESGAIAASPMRTSHRCAVARDRVPTQRARGARRRESTQSRAASRGGGLGSHEKFALPPRGGPARTTPLLVRGLGLRMPRCTWRSAAACARRHVGAGGKGRSSPTPYAHAVSKCWRAAPAV